MIIRNWFSKIIRVCNLVFHILWELCVEILENYQDKAERPLLTFVFMSLICPISNGMFPFQSVPKVLLEPNKNFIFIMKLYNLHKIGRKSTKSSLQYKTENFHIWYNNSKLALKIILGYCNMVCHILWGFRRNFYWKWTRFTKKSKKD